MTVTNLGIANIKAQIYSDAAPGLAQSVKKYHFDISAYNKDVIENSPYMKPLLMECVEALDGTFAALFPSKRKVYIDNQIAYTGGGVLPLPKTTKGSITWTAIYKDRTALDNGIFKDIVNTERFDKLPSAVWGSISISKDPQPNDESKIAGFKIAMKKSIEGSSTETLAGSSATSITSTSLGTVGAGAAEVAAEKAAAEKAAAEAKKAVDAVFPNVLAIHQKNKADGLWWAIESDTFINEENSPFWIDFKSMSPPSSNGAETCFVIRIGPDDEINKFDIYIGLNQKPKLIDYIKPDEGVAKSKLKGSKSGKLGKSPSPVVPMIKEWDVDLSRIIGNADKDRDIEVGIMTIAGRLVIIVNNIPLVYTRICRQSGDDGGRLLECKIPKGKIQIFGTNVETRILVCPMAFAELGMFALPLPTIVVDGVGTAPSLTGYQGCNYIGNPSGSVAETPSPPSTGPSHRLFGVDCKLFDGDGGTCAPYGIGFHKKGTIRFKKADVSTFSGLPSTDFFTIAMIPDNLMMAGVNIPYGGCPYFFRLKGIQEMTSSNPNTPLDISEYLISVEESAQASDYFSAKKSASLTFYNPDNIIGDMIQTSQTAFDIAWGWQKGIIDEIDGVETISTTKTFTGIAISVIKSEIAGKETITVNCEDYMYVLNKIPIINSPFYDGMLGVWAIQDLAERAGILKFVHNFYNVDNYFLPSGYAFSQPKMRYESNRTIFDCIIDMTKRFEAFVYFDGDGAFHIDKLAGGLFSDGGSTPTANFVSDPSGGPSTTILEERNVDISFDDTVNCISVFTVERDTRNAIFLSVVPSSNKLLFLKPMLINQPTLGEIEVARGWANDLGLRVFFPILKTRFKTVGADSSIVKPLDFITVDDHMFRVMSVKRSFNADKNDMSCSYECEWLGGA